MSALRRLAAVVGGAVAVLLLSPLAAIPAAAHGAPSRPVSRTFACGSEGGSTAQLPACRAAIAASGPQAFEEWDEVRVPGVDGRDRAVIPDGKLCSGGLDQYRGFDLARTDWPVTPLTAGASLTFGYRSTIGHAGTFRMYLTRAGYNPTRPLRWADLEPEPFLTVTNPELRNGSYVIPGRLPATKTGRHLIFTIWQNTSTPDTYYSCSDVLISRARAGSGTGTGPGAGPSRPTGTPAPTTPAAPTGTAGATPPPTSASPRPTPTSVSTSAAAAGSFEATGSGSGPGDTVPLVLAGVAVLLAGALAGTLLLLRRRNPRAAGPAYPQPGGRHRG